MAEPEPGSGTDDWEIETQGLDVADAKYQNDPKYRSASSAIDKEGIWW